MGWPGPRRRTVPLKLNEEEERPVQAVADAEHDGNLSAAIRALLAETLAARGRLAALERVVLHAASDLQPVVASLAIDASLDESAENLIRRAFDDLSTEALTARARTADQEK